MRPLSLRARLLCAFMGIVLSVGALPAFLGIGYLHRTLPQVRDVLAVDLNAAQEVYREYASHIADVVHLVAGRRAVRDNLQQGVAERLGPLLQDVRQNANLDLLILTDVRGEELYPVRTPGKKLAYSALAVIVARAIQQRKEIVSTVILSGMSNALLEAMACGRPSVATRVGGTPEVIEDGLSGFLVESEDDAAVAERILALLDDPARAREMGETARRVVEERFSAGRMVADMAKRYDSLIETCRPRRTSEARRRELVKG